MSALASAQQTFPSAAEASQTLFQAVQSNNEAAITKILGGPTELATSRNDDQDKVDRELFVQKYQQMHRLHREADGSMMLYIGAENWPFPIPLVQKNRAWHFDSDAGLKEVLFRRIGENELAAITTCHEFVTAEKQYRANPNASNVEDNISPVSLVAKVASGSAGSSDPVQLYGYNFRILAAGPNRTGGFALIAYPAEYRSSGVMTFIVTAKDVVYEKDLGADTSALARAMTAFHKDATWRVSTE
jgi:homogentisate 1,2-dioxygenase